MYSEADLAPDRARPLFRSEYERLVDMGVFEDQHVELLQGVLVQMTPQGPAHACVISELAERLILGLRDRAKVRVQNPFVASDISEPEPDVAVVPRESYARAHPTEAYLLVEVSGSSASKDRKIKASIYASAGVPEYWIVDVPARCVEVLTEPGPDGYARTARYDETCTVAPGRFPDVVIEVAWLFE